MSVSEIEDVRIFEIFGPAVYEIKLTEMKKIRKNHFPIFTSISAVLLLITIGLAILACFLNPRSNRSHHLSLSESFHIGVGRWMRTDPIGYIVFYSDEYGPYCGSIIAMGHSAEAPPISERICFLGNYGFYHRVYNVQSKWDMEIECRSNFPGIYYRYFKWPEKKLWTLAISLWWPLVFFSILPIFQIFKWYKKRNAKDKTMLHGEIAPAGVLKKKYNLTAENRPEIKINPENVPVNLKDLVPLAEKWGISDDIIRDDFEEEATDSEKEELRKQLSGRTKDINDWLDSFTDGNQMTTEAGHFMFMLEALDEMDLWTD